jgi:hypothetical protein
MTAHLGGYLMGWSPRGWGLESMIAYARGKFSIQGEPIDPFHKTLSPSEITSVLAISSPLYLPGNTPDDGRSLLPPRGLRPVNAHLGGR